MESGIHIGLAAWLHRRMDGAGFAAWPGAPVPLRLARSEGARTPEDMMRVAEFSRMVDFVPREGQPARPGGTLSLSGVHDALLGRMAFAERSWTDAENALFRAARAVLRDEDGEKTPLYSLYLEFRQAYADLLDAGTAPEILREALVTWELEGGRTEIGNALDTVGRLTARSTRSRARTEGDALPPLTVDPTGARYAVAGFSPVSALDESGWISATVDVADLDGEVTRSPQGAGAMWTRWRRGKTGSLHFRFAILLIDRDWFTPGLYAADDWTLADGAMVADGTGDGALPAYPRSAYLVRDVRYRPAPPKPPAPTRPTRPGRPARPPASLAVGAAVEARRPRRILSTARPGAMRVVPVAVTAATRATRAIPALAPTVALPPRPGAARFVSGPRPAADRQTLSAAPAGRFRLGRIEAIGIVEVRRRLAAARRIVGAHPGGGGGRAPEPTPDPTLWAVGFGCEPLPVSPDPHPGYRWP